jgi:hypothetical protein
VHSKQVIKKKLADKWIRKGISIGGAQLEYLKTYDGFSTI